jgi:gas vesicle protein
MKAINYFLAFLGGIAIGSAAGILLAPEKGSDTRERIAEALRKRGIRLDRKEMDALVDDITEELSNATEAVAE